VRLAAAVLGLVVGAQACTQQPPVGECDGGACLDTTAPPRLFVTPPFGLGFDCVTVGCNQTQRMTLENRGGGVVRVTRIALTSASSDDFAVEVPGTPPLELTRGNPVGVTVRYQPSDAQADEGSVRITYALEPANGPDPEPVVMALRTRSLGSPHINLPEEELNFGYVVPGENLTKTFVVENAAVAGSILAVTGAMMEDESDPAFTVLGTFPLFANSGDSLAVRVRFAPPLDPSSARTFRARLHLATNDGANPDVAVTLIGTGRTTPALDVELPGFNLDVGAVGVGGMLQKTITLRNVGGEPLNVSPRLEGAAGAGFSIQPAAGSLPPIASFERGSLVVRWTAISGGVATGTGGTLPTLVLASNDPDRPTVRIRLEAFGLLPTATPNVPRVDFGGVVVNWIVDPQTVLVRNTGAGPLTITDVFMEPGSSQQLRVEMVSGLPRMLLPEDPPVTLTLRYAPVATGAANGVLVIQSDDPNTPLKRVPVSGRGLTCEEGCPIPFATPVCATGKCEIGMCEAGHHNADELGVNGCECGEDSGGEVGHVCGGGERNLGNLVDDDGDSVTVSGTLHDTMDQDTYWFFGDDAGGVGQLFGDDFDVRVDLLNTPPGIEFCIRYSAHDVQGQGCGRGTDECGKTTFRRDGSYGTEDDQDFTVRVRFTPGTAPFCGSYTLRAKNG
jgi:hypothetical protein